MNDEEDYRISIKVRNNRLLETIESTGHTPGIKLAQEIGLSIPAYYGYINMTKSPQHKNGDWKATALKLADFLGVLPDEIFSNAHLNTLKKNTGEVRISAPELALLFGQREYPLLEDEAIKSQLGELVRKSLATLKGQEREVLAQRFGIDEDPATLDEIGVRLGVSRERVRQIEAKALRKLRQPSKCRGFMEYLSEPAPKRRNDDGWTIHEPPTDKKGQK